MVKNLTSGALCQSLLLPPLSSHTGAMPLCWRCMPIAAVALENKEARPSSTCSSPSSLIFSRNFRIGGVLRSPCHPARCRLRRRRLAAFLDVPETSRGQHSLRRPPSPSSAAESSRGGRGSTISSSTSRLDRAARLADSGCPRLSVPSAPPRATSG